jgi:hypothetical protein
MTELLANTVAVVTGAANGNGREIALRSRGSLGQDTDSYHAGSSAKLMIRGCAFLEELF